MIKSHNRNIPEERENSDDRFRVKYGNKFGFDSLEVSILRLKTGERKVYQIHRSDLPETDSIHFTTSIQDEKFLVYWDKRINSKIFEINMIDQKEIKSKLDEAIKTLYENDSFLLRESVNINERSVTHRLGMYLDSLFSEHDVDCEYNRVYDEDVFEYFKKEIELPRIEGSIELEDTEAKTVYPDIIVHKRGTRINLLVIEVKMDWKNSKGDFDIKKATAYKKSLGYQFSAYLELGQNKVTNLSWL